MLDNFLQTTNAHETYINDRQFFRVATSAAAAAIALPLLRAVLPLPNSFLRDLWLPSKPAMAGVYGALAGQMEDYHAKVAWDDTMHRGYGLEPPFWTVRTVAPCLAAGIHPLLAWKAIDGEMKGSDSAQASMERRPIQVWPWFGVLDCERQSERQNEATAPGPSYVHCEVTPRTGASDMGTAWSARDDARAHLKHTAYCRATGGFYLVHRNPVNDKWNLF